MEDFDTLKAQGDKMEKKRLDKILAPYRKRIKDLETTLKDCLSTYREDDKSVLVTVERQETWKAVLDDILVNGN